MRHVYFNGSCLPAQLVFNKIEFLANKTLRVLRLIKLSRDQLEIFTSLSYSRFCCMFKAILSVSDTTCLCFTGLLQAQNLLTQLPQQSQANLLQSQPSITLTSQVSFLPGTVVFSYPDVLTDSWTWLNHKTQQNPIIP